MLATTAGVAGKTERLTTMNDATKVAAALEQCRRDGFSGLNVTVPHKQETYRALERLDVSARRVGAVNTVRFDPDGGMTGFNTDAAGFLADLRAEFGLIGRTHHHQWHCQVV